MNYKLFKISIKFIAIFNSISFNSHYLYISIQFILIN